MKITLRKEFSEMTVKHVERPLGTNDTAANGNIDSSNVERTFGTNCSDNVNQEGPLAGGTSIIIDARELDIPYDMIIGRDSIIQHSLLLYDPEFHTIGMRLRQRDDSTQDIAHNPAVGDVAH